MSLDGNPDLVDNWLSSPPKNPWELFTQWTSEAKRVGVTEPNGLTLATVDLQGMPSTRVVLLKETNGAVEFASSGNSKKCRDIANNAAVSGTLWWRETIQQIHVRGIATPPSNERSDEVFNARERSAQAIASIGRQSQETSREQLIKIYNQTQKLVLCSAPISRPNLWSMYKIKVDNFEFWQGRKDRFHERLEYRRDERTKQWKQSWLIP